MIRRLYRSLIVAQLPARSTSGRLDPSRATTGTPTVPRAHRRPDCRGTDAGPETLPSKGIEGEPHEADDHRQQSEAAAYRLEDVVREQRHNQHTQDGQMR
jgi:hypothetical protein